MPETISCPFTFVKDGVFYFTRRIPKELLEHYSSPRIAYSLRTRSARIAEARARRAADQLDEYWYHLRSQRTELPGKHMLRQMITVGVGATPLMSPPASTSAVQLSEAVGVYLRQKGRGKSKTFHRAAERACGYVIDVCGDRPLDAYTKSDANAFRDALIARGLAGSSITRVFGTVRAVTNFAASEMGLALTNPFAGVYYDRDAGVTERQPVATEAMDAIQQLCKAADDEMRWLVALVSDTGMRLGEAAGLLREDLEADAKGKIVAHIRLHPWRRLKTKGSERAVPLEGMAEWAAKRVLATSGRSKFAFPRYNTGEMTNANSASAALNKWMKEHAGQETTMHGFRHAMRDRLRAVECPADIVDQIGGWQTDGVGHSYGSGYPIEVLR
ncbi:DUF6538 domain-containing protein [Pseudooceanicola nitratireducens]|nr:DUF6538 domain-containing protein [Pseudooceanicola nitratireducens]